MNKHLNTVVYNGVKWNDINWSLGVHEMEHCNCCSSDSAEGHQNACYYLLKNWSPAAKSFHVEQIRQALQREVAAGLR